MGAVNLIYRSADNVLELSELRNQTNAEVTGTVGAGSTTTSVVSASLLPPPVSADEFANRTLVFDETTLTELLRGRHAVISAQTIPGVLTVPALVAAPARGDSFKIFDFLNAATVQVTLKNAAGAEVSGQAWPLALSYVTGSKGKYRATLPDTLVLTENEIYTAFITVVSGSLNRTFELELKAVD